MERGRSGGARRALGTGPPDAAVRPLETPMIPVLRALLPLLPPPPPRLAAAPEPVPDSAEPRYFRACPACLVDAEQGDAWILFGSRGGCGHGMHPLCWRQYVTHCAIGARGDSHRSGLSFDARGCLRVQCPTCRSSVTGEIVLDSSGERPVRVEQLERLIIPGSEPGDSLAFIPRMPRVFVPRARRQGGRQAPSADWWGGCSGGERRAAAPPSQAPAPVEPARARLPPTTRDDLGGPGYVMARVPACG